MYYIIKVLLSECKMIIKIISTTYNKWLIKELDILLLKITTSINRNGQ